MILEIDVGNTALKWRLIDPRGSRFAGGITGNTRLEWLAELACCYSSLREARLSCVADVAVEQRVCRKIRQLWGVDVAVARTLKQHAGLVVAYTDPRRLGVDRWLAMLAARSIAHERICVVDCGSAITVDLVSAGGQHEGGYIVPGLALQKSALLGATKRIELSGEVAAPAMSWGQNTEQAVVFGSKRMTLAFLNDIIREVQANDPATFFITGGDAREFLPLLETHALYRPDLVLDGLKVAFPAGKGVSKKHRKSD